MRILSWNINGVRTLPQYHPWNTLKTFDDILNALNADIICFQEMKTTRPALTKPIALPPSYDSVFSFPVKRSGYSGVAVYTKRAALVPSKAEEGLTGLVQPRQGHGGALSADERVSSSSGYPTTGDVPPPPPPGLSDSGEPQVTVEPFTLNDLDSEGRALVLDLGLFVLINVYCPNASSTPERSVYKSAFHTLLSARVAKLIKEEGREVVLVGDINAVADVIDHCEGKLMVEKGRMEGMEGEDGFWGREERKWLRDLVSPSSPNSPLLIDIHRTFHPTRAGMYTCWNTKLSARESNYGTRIDYILITPGLRKWVKNADIEPSVWGSDHCPVWVEFWDEIEVEETGEERVRLRLKDLLGAPRKKDGEPADPPRISARFWPEYKQTLLSSFFGGGSGGTASGSSASAPSAPTQATIPPKTSAGDASNASVVLSTPSHSISPSLSHSTDADADVEVVEVASSSQTTNPNLAGPSSLSPLPLPVLPSSTSLSQEPTPTPTPTAISSSAPPVKRKLLTADNGRASSSTSNPSSSQERVGKKVRTSKDTDGKEQASIASFFGGSALAPSKAGKGGRKGKGRETEKQKPERRRAQAEDGERLGNAGLSSSSLAPSVTTTKGKRDKVLVDSQSQSQTQLQSHSDGPSYPPLSPPPSSSQTRTVSKDDAADIDIGMDVDPTDPHPGLEDDTEEEERRAQADADYQLALFLSQPSSSSSTSSTAKSLRMQTEPQSQSQTQAQSQTQQQWTSLLTRPPPPRCIVHDEPAKEWTVNKKGVNKGKRFFVCSRPVGPGYDKGRSERLREHVDKRYKCDYFKWASEVWREKGDG